MPEHDDFFQTTLPAHRPTWAEIDLDAFYHNYAAIKKRVGPGVKIIGVVKADAYGHGVDIPEMLQNEEVDMLAVAFLDEAIALRQRGIDRTDIMLLGYSPVEAIP